MRRRLCTCGSLETVLGAAVVDIVPGGCVVPAWIRHNTERVTQSGLVQPLPGAPPSLPRWLILAMRTLANCGYPFIHFSQHTCIYVRV